MAGPHDSRHAPRRRSIHAFGPSGRGTDPPARSVTEDTGHSVEAVGMSSAPEDSGLAGPAFPARLFQFGRIRLQFGVAEAEITDETPSGGQVEDARDLAGF